MMKLETAIELIKEAQKIEEKRNKKEFYDGSPEASMDAHDKCLAIARRILLEHYYERNR